MSVQKNFNCKNEELPYIAKFLYASVVRDYASFTEFSPLYSETFKTNFNSKITVVDEIVNPETLIKQIKSVTKLITDTMLSTRDYLNKLELYVNRATGLTIDPADFGIKGVRTEINTADAEGFDNNVKILLQNVDANMTQLTAVGYKAEARTALANIQTTVRTKRIEQQNLMRQKQDLVEDNMGTLNELWEIMSDVMEVGKILFGNSDPSKAEEYTMTYLKDKVRREMSSESNAVPNPLPQETPTPN